MKRFFFVFLFLVGVAACGSSGEESIFTDPLLTAIDSTNDRLFVAEAGGVLFAFTASTIDEIGDQPIVEDDDDDAIHNLLPVSPTQMAAIDVDGVSRLFITGVQADDDDDNVTNRILVLDFDGATFAEASFSPIIVGDGDDTTDDSANLLGGLAVDETNGRLYVTDATTGRLSIFSTADGTETAPAIAVDGTPNRMSLDGNRLYIANTIDTADDQVITVVNTDDLTTTEIDLDIPTNDISVESNDSGTVLLAKHSTVQQVLVRTVDTTTYAASTAIPVGDDSAVDGEINSGNGISAAVGGVVLTKDSAGTLYGYVPQADGIVELLTIASNLSSFTATALETLAEILEAPVVMTDSSENGVIVYIPASGSGDLVFTDVASDELDGRF
ncbi:MAG: hypothetical protein HYU99_04770 [Deltaproteobacteria bacterium]|nr:hypothetical protein [Deltaproteobacteria bacterium]